MSATGFCTSWGSGKEQILAMKYHFEKEKEFPSIKDLWVFWEAGSAISTNNYMVARQASYFRIQIPTSPLLVDSLPIDKREHWILLVETWFMKARLEGILRVQGAARFKVPLNHALGTHLAFKKDFGKEYLSCHRILFRNANYTNINWIGLWVITGLLVILCIASYRVKWLDKMTRATFRGLISLREYLARKLILAAKALKFSVLAPGHQNNFPIRERLSGSWVRSCISWATSGWFERHKPSSQSRGQVSNNVEEASASISLELSRPRELGIPMNT